MKIFGFTILFFGLTLNTIGQDMTLYAMPYLQQRTSLNPSFIPKSRVIVGFPGFSSVGMSLSNNGFKYSDLVIPVGDSLRFDVDNMLSKLDRDNQILSGFNYELFAVGVKLAGTYVSLNITEKVNARFNYPKDFLSLIWEGNAASIGQTSNFNFALDAIHYREYALGFAKKFGDKFTLGAKAKYLYGMEHIKTNKSDIKLQTNEDSVYALTMTTDLDIQSSGLSNADGVEQEYLFGKKNTGLAFDLGATVHLSNKLSLNASALNLGSIKWNSDVENFVSANPGGSFTYRGLPISTLTGTDTSGSSITSQLTDSIEDLFELDSNNIAYSSPVGAQYHLGLNLQLVEGQNLGIHFANNRLNGNGVSALSFYYSASIKKFLTATLSYTTINGSYNNIGAGLRLNGGPVQFYLITDNITGFLKPENTQYLNVRTGINLAFGRGKKE